MSVADQARAARLASRALALKTDDQRRQVLDSLAGILAERREAITAANRSDLEGGTAEALAGPLMQRLSLQGEKLDRVIERVRAVAELASPLGRRQIRRELAPGMVMERITVPLGVIGVVFESRPDALIQIASLCIRSGNAVVLKGGSEARESNRVLFGCVRDALAALDAGLGDAVQLVETREDVNSLLSCDQDVDLIIPRGSGELVRTIQATTRIPVLGHADGICHVYLDAACNAEMAVRITVDAKTQYPAVCNAAETLLVHADRAEELLPLIADALPDTELRVDPESRRILQTKLAAPGSAIVDAQPGDWGAEYNDLVLAVRVVESLDAAIQHINTWSSHHTDAIVTEDSDAAENFLRAVDSASVMHNVSTRMADGFRYGLGAEVGIATGRVHARGPVGLEGLTTTRYLVRGSGHVVGEFSDGTRTFTHRDLS